MAVSSEDQKALSKLNRSELLEVLLVASRKNEELQARIDCLEAQLAERNITLANAGSIAQAALQLNGVFDAAEAAASQWLDSIKTLEERSEAIQAAAERKAAITIENANMTADAIVSGAKQEAEEYWASLSGRLESFYAEHKGLQDLLELKK